MTSALPAELTCNGIRLDPRHVGPLRDSADVAEDTAELRRRLDRDGYLLLRGHLDRELAREARQNILERLRAEALLDPGRPLDEAVPAPDSQGKGNVPELAHDNEALRRLIYEGPIIALYERLLGGAIRHYDFTWMRVSRPGRHTPPHGDVVFMGRGTHRLLTAWVPLSDIPIPLGGLMVLEGSHRHPDVRDDYARRDVDTYCENVPGQREVAEGGGWVWNGTFSPDPRALRERIGGRWLTGEYRMGDLLTFTSYTLHASLDNRSDRIRLSSDSRYQLASDPVDERWIGDSPVGHGAGGKRGLIC
jgi:ectoine hydroxylase-related dioxygenase (phytanoyl-CoA dioxygenase family)